MLFSLGISFVLTALRESVKNPERKAALRLKMIQVYELIRELWPNDPAFL